MEVGHLKKVDKKHLKKAAYSILPMSKPMNITSSASLDNEPGGRASTLEEPCLGPFSSPLPSFKPFFYIFWTGEDFIAGDLFFNVDDASP